MADIAKLVEDLSQLTVMEAAELAKALEEADIAHGQQVGIRHGGRVGPVNAALGLHFEVRLTLGHAPGIEGIEVDAEVALDLLRVPELLVAALLVAENLHPAGGADQGRGA